MRTSVYLCLLFVTKTTVPAVQGAFTKACLNPTPSYLTCQARTNSRSPAAMTRRLLPVPQIVAIWNQACPTDQATEMGEDLKVARGRDGYCRHVRRRAATYARRCAGSNCTYRLRLGKAHPRLYGPDPVRVKPTADQISSTLPIARSCSTTAYGVSTICPFCICIVVPLKHVRQLIASDIKDEIVHTREVALVDTRPVHAR